jgi:putative protease
MIHTSTALQSGKPEILAPAGTPDCFHAALEAGADAVYLGVDGAFNARMRAKNFTVKTLSHLIPFAHANNRKVYVTVNTLIKQHELEAAVHLVYQLEQLGVDALIIQDMGLIDICRTHFPRLRLHASTQMALHNSSGVVCAEKMGIQRVVLARELTIAEVGAIKRNTHAELEVFVHGALCYCISGMCLASSFLGGSSGNRGRCAQVCRREFTVQRTGEHGYFFSPGDLCMLRYLNDYREAGVRSFKIEGRMKSAGYVRSVVSMYRRAVDNPAAIPELLEMADEDMSRSKTTLFAGGIEQKGIIDHTRPPGTGIYLGAVVFCGGGNISITADYHAVPGDWVRIQPANGFEGTMVRVLASEQKNNCTILSCNGIPSTCGAGDTVYLTRRAMHAIESTITYTGQVAPLFFKPYFGRIQKVLSKYRSSPLSLPHTKTTCAPSIMAGTSKWLDLLDPALFSRLLLAVDAIELKQILAGDILQYWQQKVTLCPPPFIAEGDCAQWQELVAIAGEQGIKSVFCRNAGHIDMFNATTKLFGGDMLWCINRASQKALEQLGLHGFTYSPEDDFLNISAAASSSGMFCLYGHVPLFVSRMEPVLPASTVLTDTFKAAFFTERRAGLYWLLSKKPVRYFHRRRKLMEAGITSFYIDVSFSKPDKYLIKDLLKQYREETVGEGSGAFNFKLGLK